MSDPEVTQLVCPEGDGRTHHMVHGRCAYCKLTVTGIRQAQPWVPPVDPQGDDLPGLERLSMVIPNLLIPPQLPPEGMIGGEASYPGDPRMIVMVQNAYGMHSVSIDSAGSLTDALTQAIRIPFPAWDRVPVEHLPADDSAGARLEAMGRTLDEAMADLPDYLYFSARFEHGETSTLRMETASAAHLADGATRDVWPVDRLTSFNTDNHTAEWRGILLNVRTVVWLEPIDEGGWETLTW